MKMIKENLPNQMHNLKFCKEIKRWDEAIPLGNGICGALIWGSSRELRFSLDRGDIWDTTPGEGIYAEEFSYPMLVKLAREGKNEEICRIFEGVSEGMTPSKLPTGKLIFDFQCDRNICSELNLKNAEADIRIGDSIQVKSFLHAENTVGMIHINLPRYEFTFCLENPEFGIEGVEVPPEEIVDIPTDAGLLKSLKRLSYPAPEIVSDENCKYFVQSVGRDLKYGIFVQEKKKGNCVEIAYIIASSNDGDDWIKHALEKVELALEQGYDSLVQGHKEWWSNFWSKSSIEVPDGLFEKKWYLAQYLLGSCSRKGGYPMPLQGVWTADEGALPPWKGDYHFDLNVQMSYYSYLKANHLEEGEVLIDFLYNLAQYGRYYAKKFYHSSGIGLPSTTTITGEPLGGWAMYSFSPTNHLWSCHMIARHYEYTGDRVFLETVAYPYLKESAECILGILEEKEGKYYLPISSSPEIHGNEREAFLTPNSNYDLALMKCLFQTLSKMSKELQNGEEESWNRVQQKLPDLAVDAMGRLMLSPNETLQETHRHLSHAMAIHPLRLLRYEGEENCQIIDATIWDLEHWGSGCWTGYSYAWMAELYAVQKNGNAAAKQLEIFWKCFCSPNGFHLNGDYKKCGMSSFHYRPFTLEGNFCAADALQEMLLLSEESVLQLFPAVPDEWLDKRVAFDGFRAPKGLIVSAVMEQGHVNTLILKPEYSGKIYLKIDEKLGELVESMCGEINGQMIELYLEGGTEYIFKI